MPRTDTTSLLLSLGLKIPSTRSSSERCLFSESIKWFSMATQLDICLKLMAFQGAILNRVQSFLSAPRTDLNFRHLSGCGTIGASSRESGRENHSCNIYYVGTGNIVPLKLLVNVFVFQNLIGFDVWFCDSRSFNQTPKTINYIRILDPNNKKKIFRQKKVRESFPNPPK